MVTIMSSLSSTRPDTAPAQARPPLRGIPWGIILNAAVPVILYKLSKRYYSPSEFTALVVAALFPLGKSVLGSAATIESPLRAGKDAG